MSASKPLPLLVVGAGIAGVSAALEAAEAGREVVLVEKEPAIGGRVSRLHHYFPKLCPPSCGMELNTRRLEKNPRITLATGARVTRATASEGGWDVTLTHEPRYVNDRCTACGECVPVCPAKVSDDFNLGMQEVPAIHLAGPNAWPRQYVVARKACPEGCMKCAEACTYDAVDLAATSSEETITVGAVVVATGWHPYELDNLTELTAGGDADVIANVHMERLASPSGPTGGKIVKPSNGEAPRRVAFVQCAGSRDVNHLPYCSAVCCLASLKQAMYVREQLPDAEVTIFYIDRRTPGRNEDMLTRALGMDGVRLVKGKVAKVERRGDELVLRAENVEENRIEEGLADLVVLATGMVPNLRNDKLPFELLLDEDGFGLESLDMGVAVAGVARRPEDVASSVRDATGAAAKAIVASRRRA